MKIVSNELIVLEREGDVCVCVWERERENKDRVEAATTNMWKLKK